AGEPVMCVSLDIPSHRTTGWANLFGSPEEFRKISPLANMANSEPINNDTGQLCKLSGAKRQIGHSSDSNPRFCGSASFPSRVWGPNIRLRKVFLTACYGATSKILVLRLNTDWDAAVSACEEGIFQLRSSVVENRRRHSA